MGLTSWGFSDTDGDGYADFYDWNTDPANPGITPGLPSTSDVLGSGLGKLGVAVGWASVIGAVAIGTGIYLVATNPEINKTIRSAFNPSVRVK